MFFFGEQKALIHLKRHPSSFRDPSGFIFTRDGILYRQINNCYQQDYSMLKSSGLLSRLLKEKLLVHHTEMDWLPDDVNEAFLVIRPEPLKNISYASEWSFSALKDAALLHLQIMIVAIEHGMILKDATPYNVQFQKGQPLFIDTLSFTAYNETSPWVAYRQFCENFLYPLLLEHNKLFYCHQFAASFPEGIPARVTAKLLPFRCRFNIGCWLHVYLPASISGTNRGMQNDQLRSSFSRQKMLNLINHLRSFINTLRSNDKSVTAWHNYYAQTILSQDYLAKKHTIFQTLMSNLQVTTALDLGSNDGYFSKVMAASGIAVTSIDTDAPSVNRLYLESKSHALDITPLIIDIAAPTPATGFNNTERDAFLARLDTDLIIALAVIHHLVISANIPMDWIAELFSRCNNLIIEFVPKDDPKVMQMLMSKQDIFSTYTVEAFEETFSRFFIPVRKMEVGDTGRIMYLYKKK